jgi:hypothetical protein
MSRSIKTGCLSPYTFSGREGALLVLCDLRGRGGESSIKERPLGRSGERSGKGGGPPGAITGEGVRATPLGPGNADLVGVGDGALGIDLYSGRGALGGESNDRPGVLTGTGA